MLTSCLINLKKSKKGNLWQSQSFVKAGGAVVVCVPRLSDPWSLGGGGAIISHELFALFKLGFLLS
jgi:hypothetical protein